MCPHFRTHWYSPRLLVSLRRERGRETEQSSTYYASKSVFSISTYPTSQIYQTHFSDNRLGGSETVSNLAKSPNL